MRCPSLAVLCAAVSIMTATASAGADSFIEREFRFAPERFSSVERDGITEIKVEGGFRDLTPGRPDLPWVSETVEVAAGLAKSVRLASTLEARPEPTQVRSAPNPEWFSRRGFQPETAVRAGYQGHQRGKNLASLVITPVRWDAATGRLERVTRVKVRMKLTSGMEAPLERLRIVPEW